jgi:hypothetical protein
MFEPIAVEGRDGLAASGSGQARRRLSSTAETRSRRAVIRLIAALTGSGKTLALFLAEINAPFEGSLVGSYQVIAKLGEGGIARGGDGSRLARAVPPRSASARVAESSTHRAGLRGLELGIPRPREMVNSPDSGLLALRQVS